MQISPSSIANWKRCRRRWDLTDYNRQALQPVGLEAEHFYVGSAIHRALEAQAKGDDPGKALYDYWETVEARGTTDDDTWNMVVDVVHHYLDRYGWHKPLAPFEYVATELTFRCAIPNTGGELIGTFDGIVVNPDTKKVWIVDHKSYQREPKLEVQEFNEQFIAYQWAFYQLFGHLPEGVIYDGIRKKAPKMPSVLKSGKLSVDLRGVSYHSYMRAIKDNRLDVDDYKDQLYELSVRNSMEQNDFFTRWFIRCNPALLETFEEQLQAVYHDMSTVKDYQLYPTFNTIDGCYDCPVRPICHGMQRGDNVRYVIDTAFTRSEGYGTTKAQGDEPISVEELGAHLYGTSNS